MTHVVAMMLPMTDLSVINKSNNELLATTRLHYNYSGLTLIEFKLQFSPNELTIFFVVCLLSK